MKRRYRPIIKQNLSSPLPSTTRDGPIQQSHHCHVSIADLTHAELEIKIFGVVFLVNGVWWLSAQNLFFH